MLQRKRYRRRSGWQVELGMHLVLLKLLDSTPRGCVLDTIKLNAHHLENARLDFYEPGDRWVHILVAAWNYHGGTT